VAGLGIDLGTANTVVCDSRRGILLDEPSVLALRTDSGRTPRVLGLGRDANALVGRTPTGIEAVRPLQDGVVVDLDVARSFLRAVLRRVHVPLWRRQLVRAVIGVPAGATPLQRRALLEVADQSNLPRVTLLAEPIAGAAGAGLDPLERRAHMVVDVGGGTAEVTAFSYGGILANRSVPVAGDEMTFAVYQFLRLERGVVVGELAAEQVKIRATGEEGPSFVVQGQDAATGRPRLVTVTMEEISEAIRPVTEGIISALVACLEDLPPQAVSDVNSEGVLVFGGGSLVRGFDKALEAALGFSVRRAEKPLTCVAEGAAQCLEDTAILRAYTHA
jgi:rod shape-determining protein MreB